MKAALAIGLSVAVMALTGCTTTEAGTAVAAQEPPEPPAVSSGEAAPEVPSVADPLDASRYVADPCAVLTQAQLTSYGMRPTGRPNSGTSAENAGPRCLWLGAGRSPNVTVGWLTPNVNGLADIYSIQEDGTWDYFEETEVEEYPAVFNYFADDPQHGNCVMTVGVSDGLTYSVYVQGKGIIDGQTGCDLVAQVAEAVIRKLKEHP